MLAQPFDPALFHELRWRSIGPFRGGRTRAATGVPGLDDILSGGFAKGALFLVEGTPGTGKTTLVLRFLMEGAGHGERSLYITLSETRDELLRGAASHGWTLDSDIEIFELQPPASR